MAESRAVTKRLLRLLLAGWPVKAALVLLALDATSLADAPDKNLIQNASLAKMAADGKTPLGFELSGQAIFGPLGGKTEPTGRGFRLQPRAGRAAKRSGSVATTVADLPRDAGRWYRFRVRALAQDGFGVEQDDLYLAVEFFRDGGRNSLDQLKQRIYPLVVQERAALADPGTNPNLGGAAWRSYDLEFRTPYAEIDTLRVSVGFDRGAPRSKQSEFWIAEMSLRPIAVPADYVPPAAGGKISLGREALASLVPLGGRWYFDPRGTSAKPPQKFDHSNSDRLLYLADRLEAPFADNMTAWLRAGYLDRAAKMVKADKFVPDNVVVSFTPTHLVMHTKGLPNHPTATFPDRFRAVDGNPNYIQEQDETLRIPLVPQVNPAHRAMQNQNNLDRALPGGPIGVAVNGVVFFNPFDASQNEDAIYRLDRCCGHPNPHSQYHYHKYPVCVKSPWCDDGADHSPLIGFALDGFAVYGPYESAGQLAKDSTSNPLNEFNGHADESRGWHYHVTPGRFPHIVGGFWGQVDASVSNRRPPGPPGQGPGGPNGPGPGGGGPMGPGGPFGPGGSFRGPGPGNGPPFGPGQGPPQ